MFFTEEGKVVLPVESLEGDVEPDCPRCEASAAMVRTQAVRWNELLCKRCGYVTPDKGFYLVEKRGAPSEMLSSEDRYPNLPKREDIRLPDEPDTPWSARAAALHVTQDKLMDINNELDDLRHRLRDWERAYACDVLVPDQQLEITAAIVTLREMFVNLHVLAQKITIAVDKR